MIVSVLLVITLFDIRPSLLLAVIAVSVKSIVLDSNSKSARTKVMPSLKLVILLSLTSTSPSCEKMPKAPTFCKYNILHLSCVQTPVTLLLNILLYVR